MTENKKLNEVELVVVDTNVAVEEVGPQCGQLKPRMLKIQRFWAYILDFFI